MSSPRIAYGSLHRHGAGLLPDDLEGIDYLLLDGGPVAVSDKHGRGEMLDEAVRRIAPTLYLDPNVRVVASLGGDDPERATRRVSAILSETGNADLRLGAVKGANLLDRLEEFLAAGHALRNNKTGEPFSRTKEPPRSAQLALGADPLGGAFEQDARLVLLGHADLETIRLRLLGELRGHASSTPLEMKLEAGFSSRVVIRRSEGESPDAMQQLENAWLRTLQEAGLSIEQAAFEAAASNDADGADLAIGTYRSDRAPVASSGTRCLMGLASSGDAGSARFEVVLGPVVEPLYTAWPTSLPTDLVEWSADVRPAKDWLE